MKFNQTKNKAKCIPKLSLHFPAVMSDCMCFSSLYKCVTILTVNCFS